MADIKALLTELAGATCRRVLEDASRRVAELSERPEPLDEYMEYQALVDKEVRAAVGKATCGKKRTTLSCLWLGWCGCWQAGGMTLDGG